MPQAHGRQPAQRKNHGVNQARLDREIAEVFLRHEVVVNRLVNDLSCDTRHHEHGSE